jgi:hypothetical protein
VPGDLVEDFAPAIARNIVELNLEVLEIPLDQLVG